MEGRIYYQEAMRYIEKAEKELEKADKHDQFYTDKKHLKSTAKTAYCGVERAAKWYIGLRGVTLPDNAGETELKKALYELDKNLLTLFQHLYAYLHVAVYYHGAPSVAAMEDAIENAKEFISCLIPTKLR